MSYILDALKKSQQQKEQQTQTQTPLFAHDNEPSVAPQPTSIWVWIIASGILVVCCVFVWLIYQQVQQANAPLISNPFDEVSSSKTPPPSKTTTTATTQVKPSASGTTGSNKPYKTQDTAVITPEPVTPEPVTPKPVTPEPVMPEPVMPEPVTPEPVTPEPVMPEPVTPEPVTPEPVTPEPVTPEPVTPEPVIPEPVTPEPVTPESVMPETTTQPIQGAPISALKRIPKLVINSHIFSTLASKRKVTINNREYQEGDWITDEVQLHEITQHGVRLKVAQWFIDVGRSQGWQAL